MKLEGELYELSLSRINSQALAARYLRKNDHSGTGLAFVALDIVGSVNDEIEDIKQLKSWFFEISPTNWTTDPR